VHRRDIPLLMDPFPYFCNPSPFTFNLPAYWRLHFKYFLELDVGAAVWIFLVKGVVIPCATNLNELAAHQHATLDQQTLLLLDAPPLQLMFERHRLDSTSNPSIANGNL